MIEGCALRSAEAQLRDAVHYSPKSLEEEDATIAWLAAASTGGDGPSSSGDERAISSEDAATSDESLRQAHAQSTWLLPLAAIEQAQLPLPTLPWQAEGARTATPLNGSSSWHRLSSTLEAQRWREWTLVSLRRWEQSAYRTAWQELQRLLLQEEDEEEDDDENPD